MDSLSCREDREFTSVYNDETSVRYIDLGLSAAHVGFVTNPKVVTGRL
jgi:hypothetical protein